jgi:phosphoglycerate dehydrogenase-like enzyme
MTRVAVLDDWQNVAEKCADWRELAGVADLHFFRHAFASQDDAANALKEFDVLIAMRERTAFPAALIERLPALRLIVLTGGRAPSLDMEACTRKGILVCNTGGGAPSATAELALGLMIAAYRPIASGDAAIRAGRFQEDAPLGTALAGRTLGVIGLGKLGARMAKYGLALEMNVLAWSQNLTQEHARDVGVTYANKEELLERSDVVSLHLVLSDRTRGILGARDLERMKPGAVLVNTSRGPLVDEHALIRAVQEGRIVAALDVFDREPLPADHPFRHARNTVLTPHIGYNTRDTFERFYRDAIEDILSFLRGSPVRMLNPEVLQHS